jgi:hypothetical protein
MANATFPANVVDIMVLEALEKRHQMEALQRNPSPSLTSASSATIRYWDSKGRTLYHVATDSNRTKSNNAGHEEIAVNVTSGPNDKVQEVLI